MTRASDGKPHICLDEIDKVPHYKEKIKELQCTVTGLLEHNNYLQSKVRSIWIDQSKLKEYWLWYRLDINCAIASLKLVVVIQAIEKSFTYTASFSSAR